MQKDAGNVKVLQNPKHIKNVQEIQQFVSPMHIEVTCSLQADFMWEHIKKKN